MPYQFNEVNQLPLEKLVVSPHQSRTQKPEQDLEELTASIRANGLLHPIIAVPMEGEDEKYEIISGQRRFLACQKLGYETIPVRIPTEPITDLQKLTISFTENLHRQDLTSPDVVKACIKLWNHYRNLELIAAETGIPRARLQQNLKYQTLHPLLKEAVDQGKVSIDTMVRAQAAQKTQAMTDANPEETLELAKSMQPLSNVQQDRIVKNRQQDPNQPIDQLIGESHDGQQVKSMNITMSAEIHQQLSRRARQQNQKIGETAAELLEQALGQEE